MNTKLNSTGSFWLDDEGNYWSYNTQLTVNYNDYRIINTTFYSMTTRKHQAQIEKRYKDILCNCGHYGFIRPVEDLTTALRHVKERLTEFEQTRNSKFKQLRIDDCKNYIKQLETVLNTQSMEVV